MVYQGRAIPTQEAPPRRSALRDASANQAYQRSDDGTRFMKRIAAFLPDAEELPAPAAVQRRKPTPRMQAYWNAVQEAKSRGLSLRGIARALGISRHTVTKYARVSMPPVYGEGSAEGNRDRRLTESLVSSP